jgi:hypothetical protein
MFFHTGNSLLSLIKKARRHVSIMFLLNISLHQLQYSRRAKQIPVWVLYDGGQSWLVAEKSATLRFAVMRHALSTPKLNEFLHDSAKSA